MDIIKALLDARADIGVVNQQGQRPQDCSVVTMVQLLVSLPIPKLSWSILAIMIAVICYTHHEGRTGQDHSCEPLHSDGSLQLHCSRQPEDRRD